MKLLLLLLSVLALEVLKSSLNLTLHTNETFNSDLLDLFKGSNLQFQQDCPNASCFLDTIVDFTEINSIPMANRQTSKKARITTTPSPDGYYILIYSELTVYILELNLATKLISEVFSRDASIDFPGAVILQGILCESFFVLFVRREEIFQENIFIKHEALYSDLSFKQLNMSKCFWDLRYSQDVIMSASDSNILAFGVRKTENKRGQVFIFNYSNPECPDLIQFIDRYFIVPEEYGDLWYPDPIDITIQQGKMLILNSNNILVSLLLENRTFLETSYTNFTDFNKVESLSSPNNIYANQPVATICSKKAVTIYEVSTDTEVYYLSSSLPVETDPVITLSQIIYPEVFFSSFNNDSGPFFEFAHFSPFFNMYMNIEDLTFYSNQTNIYAPWIVLPGKLGGKFLVRQEFDGVWLFYFKIPTFKYQISATENTDVLICAEDEESRGCCIIRITVLDTIYNISFTVDHKEDPENLFYKDVYFYNLNQLAPFIIETFVTGWNVSYNLEISFINQTEYYYEIIDYPVLKLLENIHLDIDAVKGAYYNYCIYFIDQIGRVFFNGSLLDYQYIGAFDVIPVITDTRSIIISYPANLQFRMQITSKFTNISLLYIGYDCIKVKNYKSLTICSSNFDLCLIDRDLHIFVNISYNQLDYEKIVDFEFAHLEVLGYSYLYILTDQNLYLYSLNGNLLYLENKISILGKAIFLGGENVCVVDVNEYTLLDVYINKKISSVYFLSPYEKAFLWRDALSVQSNGTVYVYETTNNYLNALSFTFDIGDCQLQGSSISTYMVLCEDYALFYSSNCPPICHKFSKVNFTLTNIQNLTSGMYEAVVPVLAYNSVNSVLFHVYYTLFTYGAANFFDYSQINLNISYGYDIAAEMDLQYFINGYSIKTDLLINNQSLKAENSEAIPVRFINRSTLTNQYKSNEKIVDFTIVKDANLILALTDTSILIFKDIAPFNYTNLNKLSYNQSIDISTLTQGQCESIDFVMRTMDYACFVCSCSNPTEITGIYYDGRESSYYQIESYLVIFDLSLKNLTIKNKGHFTAIFKTNFLKIITGTDFHFLILQVTLGTHPKDITLNNHVFILKCIWQQDGFIVSQMVDLNFYILGLTLFQVSDVDGLYLESSNGSDCDELYLYITDFFYGVRSVYICNSEVSLFQSIYLSQDDFLESVSVCGSRVFVSTFQTYLIVFLISSDYRLDFYTKYPASPVETFSGVNSFLSCSNYYHPTYLSFFLKNETADGRYKLRILNLHSSFNSSVHTDVNIVFYGSEITRAKSLFLDENTIIYLNSNFTKLDVLYQSSPKLVFPALSSKDWKEMKKKYGSDSFQLVVQSSNFAITKNSSQLVLTRIGPDSDDDDTEVKILIYIVIIVASFIVVLLAIAVCVYKKTIKKKIKIKPVKKPRIEFSIQRMSTLVNRSILKSS